MKIIITNLRSWMETHYYRIRYFYTTHAVLYAPYQISFHKMCYYSTVLYSKHYVLTKWCV